MREFTRYSIVTVLILCCPIASGCASIFQPKQTSDIILEDEPRYKKFERFERAAQETGEILLAGSAYLLYWWLTSTDSDSQ